MISVKARRTAPSLVRFRRTPPTSVLCWTLREPTAWRRPGSRARARAPPPRRRCARCVPAAIGRPNAPSTVAVSSPVSQRSPSASSAARQTARASSTRMSSKLQSRPGGWRAPFGVGRDLGQRARGVLRERERRHALAADDERLRPPAAGHQAGEDRLARRRRRRVRRRCRRESPAASRRWSVGSTGV